MIVSYYNFCGYFFTEDSKLYEQQLFSLLSEMRKAFDVDDDDDVDHARNNADVGHARDDDERLGQGPCEAERGPVRRSDVDWSNFGAYVDEVVMNGSVLPAQHVEEI